MSLFRKTSSILAMCTKKRCDQKNSIKTGGKKFDEQKYEKKVRAPGDKLFTHQFQTAERILAPDWAEKFSAQSGASIRSAARFDFRLRPHYLPLGLRDGVVRGTGQS